MFVQNLFGSKAVFLLCVKTQYFASLRKTLYIAPPDHSGFAFIVLFYYVYIITPPKSAFISARLQFLCIYTIFIFSCQSPKRGISITGNISAHHKGLPSWKWGAQSLAGSSLQREKLVLGKKGNVTRHLQHAHLPKVGQASSPDIMMTSGDACPTFTAMAAA